MTSAANRRNSAHELEQTLRLSQMPILKAPIHISERSNPKHRLNSGQAPIARCHVKLLPAAGENHEL